MRIICEKVILNHSTVCKRFLKICIVYFFCVYTVFKDIEFKLSEKDIEIRWKNWKKCLKESVLKNINFNVG